jgi:hypothetical protein
MCRRRMRYHKFHSSFASTDELLRHASSVEVPDFDKKTANDLQELITEWQTSNYVSFFYRVIFTKRKGYILVKASGGHAEAAEGIGFRLLPFTYGGNLLNVQEYPLKSVKLSERLSFQN